MELSRPFAYNNTGSPISGTTQYGDLYTQKSFNNFQINILKYKTP